MTNPVNAVLPTPPRADASLEDWQHYANQLASLARAGVGMAAAIDWGVHTHTLDPRSPAGDARLCFDPGPFGRQDCISILRRFVTTFRDQPSDYQVLSLEQIADTALALWTSFLTVSSHIQLLASYQPSPNALGLKVANRAELIAAQDLYTRQGDQTHSGPVNDRSITTIRRREPIADTSINQIKLVQRQPGRTDPLGLDHLDILLTSPGPDPIDLEVLCHELLAAGVNCELESNDTHTWISVRWDGFEIKLVDQPVWAVCLKQMQGALES